MLMFVEKLVTDLDLRKQRCLVQIRYCARLLVLPRLLQIHAVARAIERDLALLTAALRADAAMHRWAEALLFTFFADRTTHNWVPVRFIIPRSRAPLRHS